MSLQGFTRLCVIASALALIVLIDGVYLRLAQVGLSCPHGPGCYGPILARADGGQPAQQAAQDLGAWHEPLHRRAEGLLGLSVLAIAVVAWRRRQRPGQRLLLPIVVLLLVSLQAAFGIWGATVVSAQLMITAELLAGLTTAALLWWLALRHGGLFTGYARPLLGNRRASFGAWVVLGVLLLYAQLFLGAWVSSNGAAFECADFPLCQGELFPALALEEALRLWPAPGAEASGLALDARVTIHLLHRLGAVVLLLYLGGLSIWLLRGAHDARLKAVGGALGLVLTAQIGAGIANVLLGLPLIVAVAHSAGAALLLLTLVSVYHVTRPPRSAV